MCLSTCSLPFISALRVGTRSRRAERSRSPQAKCFGSHDENGSRYAQMLVDSAGNLNGSNELTRPSYSANCRDVRHARLNVASASTTYSRLDRQLSVSPSLD